MRITNGHYLCNFDWMKTALLVLWVFIAQYCFGQSIERQVIASMVGNTTSFQGGANCSGYRIDNFVDPAIVVSSGFQQQTLSQIVHIPESNKVQFSMYPNPFFSELWLSTDSEIAELWILSSEGKVILKDSFSGSCVLNLIDLTEGLYFFYVRNGEGQIGTYKAIKLK